MQIDSRKQLGDLIKHLGLTKGVAEIGVAEGSFSSQIIEWGTFPLYLVDRWLSVPEDYGDSGFDQEWHDTNYRSVLERTQPHGGKCIVLRGDSSEMANSVPDNSLSLVYLDANHTYEGVKRDIEAWYPKVEEGGIIAGHDYFSQDYGVHTAINEFVNGRFDIIPIPENELNNASFYFIKRQKQKTMAVTCYFSGRLGNIFYNIAMLIAYAKKHNLQYYIPTEAIACTNRVPTITVPSTGPKPVNPSVYREPNMSQGNPYYHEIPYMDNVLFDGYYQSFKYFNWCRQDVLDAFNLPHVTEYGVVGVSVRRGDCVGSEPFPMAPTIYYHRAIEHMQKLGHNHFRLYSDDIPWCKEEFTTVNYPGATFEFSEGRTELEDYTSLTQCEHNITARSTFSLTAAWMNQNPDKIVLVPQENMWWKSQNRNLLTDSGFTQIFFPQEYHPHMLKYTYTYKDISFKLIIQNYWKDIYRGVEQEPLYPDYCKMLDLVQQCSKDRYVLDIGANHGIFAVPCSLLGYKVLAFEPVERNVNSIQLAAIENKLTNFTICPYALSDKTETIDIYVPECSDNASLSKDASISNMIKKDYSTETIQCVRFDDWIKEYEVYKDIGFIKLDVQGAEYKIVEGMKEFLEQAHNLTVVCEYEHHLVTMGHSFEQMDNLFTSLGFEYKGHLTPNDKIFYKA